jgi:hypothetical protein
MIEEKEREGYVEFSKNSANRIREHGEEVILVCEGRDGGQFELVIRVKNPLPVKPLPVFIDAPPVFVVTGDPSGISPPEK